MDLFEAAALDDPERTPLAERMRPRTLDEIVGQPQLCSNDAMLRRALRRGRLPSVLLWGPPGSGKTTLARALSAELSCAFEQLSAVSAGVKDVRHVVEMARRAQMQGRSTVLFLDEIHRFNKAQQDALLPHVERGLITLVGATTENPSFEVNAALLSRCRVLVTRPLDDDALQVLLDRALTTPKRGLGEHQLQLSTDAAAALKQSAQGDARRLLTALEVAADMALADAREEISLADVEQAVARRVLLHDRQGDAHYGVISAFIKSMRASDPDAALHYLARLLEAGEDPRFILRRMVIFASEDVGCADSRALLVATAALQSYELIGMPEGLYPLAHAALHLSCAPKSRTVGEAYYAARDDVRQEPNAEIPPHLLNAPTALMRALGYGAKAEAGASNLPAPFSHQRYYHPSSAGAEAAIATRLRARSEGPKNEP